jgi:hypothetical protein
MDDKEYVAEYILPPHPEAVVVLGGEITKPEEPIQAEFTLSDLIRQAVQQEIRREIIRDVQD